MIVTTTLCLCRNNIPAGATARFMTSIRVKIAVSVVIGSGCSLP